MAEKLAVVTGASSGIGFNLAKVFAENGFDLVIDAEDASVNKAATELKALGVQVTPVVADLATYDGCKKFWQAVEAADRKVDAVAINAGIGVGGCLPIPISTRRSTSFALTSKAPCTSRNMRCANSSPRRTARS